VSLRNPITKNVIHNKTRKGGKLYGNGAWGTVYDIKNNNPRDMDTILKKIGEFKNPNNTPAIMHNVSTVDDNNGVDIIVGDKATVKLINERLTEITKSISPETSSEDVDTSSLTYGQSLVVGKLFKYNLFKFSVEKEFTSEMNQNASIQKILVETPGSQPLSAITTLTIDNKNYIGFSIPSKQMYVIFYKKCGHFIVRSGQFRLEEDADKRQLRLDQSILDILKILNKLNKANTFHNDVKFANMLSVEYGPDNNKKLAYILADYGAANKIPDDQALIAKALAKRGDPVFTSPLKILFIKESIISAPRKLGSNVPMLTLSAEADIKKKPDWDFLKKDNNGYRKKLEKLLQFQHEEYKVYRKNVYDKYKKEHPMTMISEGNVLRNHIIDKKLYLTFDLYMFAINLFLCLSPSKFNISETVHEQYMKLIFVLIDFENAETLSELIHDEGVGRRLYECIYKYWLLRSTFDKRLKVTVKSDNSTKLISLSDSFNVFIQNSFYKTNTNKESEDSFGNELNVFFEKVFENKYPKEFDADEYRRNNFNYTTDNYRPPNYDSDFMVLMKSQFKETDDELKSLMSKCHEKLILFFDKATQKYKIYNAPKTIDTPQASVVVGQTPNT